LEESQIRERLRQGQLSPDTFYWKEGMPEWRPLREIVFLEPPGPPFRLQVSLDPWTTLLKASLALKAFLALLLLSFVVVLPFLFDFHFALVIYRAMGFILRGILFVGGVVAIPMMIFFFIWIYRIQKNCRGFADGLRFTPSFAVGGWFIPLACFVYPFLVMEESWKVSGDPANWKRQKGSVLVRFWWVFWLLSSIVNCVVLLLPKEEGISVIRGFGAVSSDLLVIISLALTFALVSDITGKQKCIVGLTNKALLAPSPGDLQPNSSSSDDGESADW
jgi:hypothetical protein